MNLKNNKDNTIAILISTFNGEKFLKQLLDSILNQTFKDFKVIIRDDGSNDNTISVISEYVELFPNKINILIDNEGNLGSTKSFFKLLNEINNEKYTMFADQDDFWFENKLEIFLTKIQELEIIYGSDLPALVFGDMVVVDRDLRIIENSFWNYQKINPNIIYNWKKTLSQNVVTGCSMIINNKSVQLVKKAPNFKMIHDHFIAICISKNGVVNFIKEPTMFYIQHNNNVLGASSYDFKFALFRINKLKSTIFVYYELCKYFNMSFIKFVFYKISINLKRFF
jgi:glycosyltransferase involved in cell wall biosynthesis